MSFVTFSNVDPSANMANDHDSVPQLNDNYRDDHVILGQELESGGMGARVGAATIEHTSQVKELLNSIQVLSSIKGLNSTPDLDKLSNIDRLKLEYEVLCLSGAELQNALAEDKVKATEIVKALDLMAQDIQLLITACLRPTTTVSSILFDTVTPSHHALVSAFGRGRGRGGMYRGGRGGNYSGHGGTNLNVFGNSGLSFAASPLTELMSMGLGAATTTPLNSLGWDAATNEIMHAHPQSGGGLSSTFNAARGGGAAGRGGRGGRGGGGL